MHVIDETAQRQTTTQHFHMVREIYFSPLHSLVVNGRDGQDLGLRSNAHYCLIVAHQGLIMIV